MRAASPRTTSAPDGTSEPSGASTAARTSGGTGSPGSAEILEPAKPVELVDLGEQGPLDLIAVLCLLNPLLTFGVIRKLRAQAERKADSVAEGLIIPAGSPAPPFSVVTTAGEPVTRESIGETMPGFFSPDCRACKERLPLFVEQARTTARETGRSVSPSCTAPRRRPANRWRPCPRSPTSWPSPATGRSARPSTAPDTRSSA
ncbi:hypothetical protein GCM10010289_03100 [Streptomyces violascens]|uniref:Uncharacterized protein n=1 Tax=Streptomyces violascens TaxID=67381 RepID=A0ABQ3QFB8_9ACTN|nr:hypothetical protein GCM10010289_03100 [Streptomyces violascens]GHI35976.1 hypothetical protein Sviol_03840 [Streptomyces violascens]